MLYQGPFPRIHDRKLDAADWYSSYFATYVQRDVRDLGGVGDLVIDDGTRLLPVEIKAGLTLRGGLYDGLDWFCASGAPAADHGVMVYGGE